MLVPVLFVLSRPTADLISLIESHGLSTRLYDDDTPAAVDALSSFDLIVYCRRDVTNWMRSNRLQLNSDKT